MSNDSILESPTNTDGFIDAQSGTVKTLLPPNSRSFILGPLVDGYNYNHGYDDFTRIGYIQKDTRQFVLLATIQGHWNSTPNDSPYTARVWDGTSSQFTAYNSNFTLAMAQWFKDRITVVILLKTFLTFIVAVYFKDLYLINHQVHQWYEWRKCRRRWRNEPGDGDGKLQLDQVELQT